MRLTPNEIAIANMVLIALVAWLTQRGNRVGQLTHDAVNSQSEKLAATNAATQKALTDTIQAQAQAQDPKQGDT